jgi:ABC-type sugar transport system permease subunit
MNSRVKTAWLFLAPMVLLMLVVAMWPLARSIWFSFTDININEMIWWFKDPRDQTLFTLRNGSAQCIRLQSQT